MATWNSANGSYQSGNKTLFEVQGLATPNGMIVSNTNPLPVTGLSANSIASAPFEWQVALGNIDGATQVNIFGYTATVNATPAIVWENSPREYAYINTAQRLSVNSSSVTDDSCKVLISGLDANWAPLSEVVQLNGTTVVTTNNAFLRVNSMILTQPGAGQEMNIGHITAYYNSTKLAIIDPNAGRTQMSQYSVANNYTLFVQNVNIFSGDAAGASKYMNFRVDVKNNVSNVNFILLHTTWQNGYQLPRVNPFGYAGKSDVRWQLFTNSGEYTGSVVIEAILIRNS